MEIFETLNISSSFEEIEPHIFSHTTAPSLKSSALSQDRSSSGPEEKMIAIISANLNSYIPEITKQKSKPKPQISSHPLRCSYKSLKAKYLSSELQKNQLQAELYGRTTRKCNMCELLRTENKSTKKTLEEAIQLSSILLNELQRLSEFN